MFAVDVCKRETRTSGVRGCVITTIGAWGYRKGWQEWREDHGQVGRPASEDANRSEELSAGALKTLDMMGRVGRGWCPGRLGSLMAEGVGAGRFEETQLALILSCLIKPHTAAEHLRHS